MSKLIKFNNDARQKIENGLKTLSDAVSVTLGPGGKNVLIDNIRGIHSTKDGVTVAKSIVLDDPFENMAVNAIREAAEKSNSLVGDGTTSTTILTYEIYKQGMQYISMGANSTQIFNGIQKAARVVADYLSDNSLPIKSIDDIRHIATVSANGDEEIGNIIAEVMDKIGIDGTIKIEQGRTMTIDSRIVEGMVLDSSYVSPYMVTDESRMEVDFDNPYILLVNKKITNIQEFLEPLQMVSQANKPIVIIADDFQEDVISTLIINKLRGVQCVAVKSPSYGEQRKFIMDDIAIVCGAKVVSDETGITPTNDVLGMAKRVIVNKENTVIVGGYGDEEAIKSRADDLRNQIEALDDDWEKNRVAERLAKITSGVGIISVGGTTENIAKTRRDLVDDAFGSAKSAVRGGIISGGGSSLLASQTVLEAVIAIGELFTTEDEKTGAKIVSRALTAPIKKILENAGVQNYELIVSQIQAKNDPYVGYSVHEGKITNMIESNIVDATDVVKSAIINSASVAGLLLTTECLITEKPSEKQQMPQMPMM